MSVRLTVIFLSAPLSVCSCVCPSVRPSIDPSVRPFVRPTVRPLTVCYSGHLFICIQFDDVEYVSSFSHLAILFVHPSVLSSVRSTVRPSVRPFVRPFVRSSARSSVRPSVRPSVCQPVSLSVAPPVHQFNRTSVRESAVHLVAIPESSRLVAEVKVDLSSFYGRAAMTGEQEPRVHSGSSVAVERTVSRCSLDLNCNKCDGHREVRPRDRRRQDKPCKMRPDALDTTTLVTTTPRTT